ncbi:MAG: creatininase family protein [Spirochaetaceae bacterium]|nr:MAG: creatininase family protein [Spirochaetaceae bacterium]
MIRDWDITETNLGRLAAGPLPDVAILTTAAVEPHNRHLPEGQDLLHATYVSRTVAEGAYTAGARVIWLPAIPFGVDSNLLDFPIAVHVSRKNIDAMLSDVIRSCASYGIRKFVIINGHGGNDFVPFVRAIQAEIPVHVFLCDWWKVGDDRYAEIFEQPEDHAGEMETSVALALFPHLVEIERAGDGVAAEYRFGALNRGWLRTSRRFSRLNDHCAVGTPFAATAEKGHEYLELVIERITEFVVELAHAELDPAFPMEAP